MAKAFAVKLSTNVKIRIQRLNVKDKIWIELRLFERLKSSDEWMPTKQGFRIPEELNKSLISKLKKTDTLKAILFARK